MYIGRYKKKVRNGMNENMDVALAVEEPFASQLPHDHLSNCGLFVASKRWFLALDRKEGVL